VAGSKSVATADVSRLPDAPYRFSTVSIVAVERILVPTANPRMLLACRRRDRSSKPDAKGEEGDGGGSSDRRPGPEGPNRDRQSDDRCRENDSSPELRLGKDAVPRLVERHVIRLDQQLLFWLATDGLFDGSDLQPATREFGFHDTLVHATGVSVDGAFEVEQVIDASRIDRDRGPHSISDASDRRIAHRHESTMEIEPRLVNDGEVALETSVDHDRVPEITVDELHVPKEPRSQVPLVALHPSHEEFLGPTNCQSHRH
jgi:hypothetical protein